MLTSAQRLMADTGRILIRMPIMGSAPWQRHGIARRDGDAGGYVLRRA